MRLLQCRVCKELEELPDFDGDPWDDVLLEEIVNRHHARGGHEGEHVAALIRDIKEEDWRSPTKRQGIIKALWEKSGGLDEFTDWEYYATKDTFTEDAGKCWIKHRRTIPCIDYRTPAKRLGNPHRESFKNPKAAVYLCDFCPYQSEVTTNIRASKGMYD